jgi:hypothetical protein
MIDSKVSQTLHRWQLGRLALHTPSIKTKPRSPITITIFHPLFFYFGRFSFYLFWPEKSGFDSNHGRSLWEKEEKVLIALSGHGQKVEGNDGKKVFAFEQPHFCHFWKNPFGSESLMNIFSADSDFPQTFPRNFYSLSILFFSQVHTMTMHSKLW